jgi:hypothetical protein
MLQGGAGHQRLIVELPEQERYFGLENLGNTCCSNSRVVNDNDTAILPWE